MKELLYSLNEDEFYELDELLDLIKYDYQDEIITNIYVGEKNPVFHSNFVCGSSIIEDITNRAYENFDDLTDNYCGELETKEHYKNIEKVILEYLNENISQPNFYEILNVRKVPLSEVTKEQI